MVRIPQSLPSMKSLIVNWWSMCTLAGWCKMGSFTLSHNCCCKFLGTRVLGSFGPTFPCLQGELAGELEINRFFVATLWDHVGASVDTACEWISLVHGFVFCAFSKWATTCLFSVSYALNFVLWARLNQLNSTSSAMIWLTLVTTVHCSMTL